MVISRLSGVVTFTDGTIEQFSVQLDDQGNISSNDSDASQSTLASVASSTMWLEQMLSLIPTSISLTLIDLRSKVPSSMAAELSGRITYDNGTWGDWIVQYTSELGAFVPNGGSVDNFVAATGVDLAQLTQMFENIIGTGNVAIGEDAELTDIT